MLRFLWVALTSAAVVLSSVAAIAEPLHATGEWDLDYGETECTASRPYGNPADPVTLAIRQSPNGENYEILVARKYRVSEPATEEQGSVDFGIGNIKAWALFYQTVGKTLDVHQLRISATEMAQARSAKSMALHISGSSDFIFELALMPQLLDGLQACTADLKQYWNMDAEKSGEIAKGPRGDVRGVFSADDYPAEAMSRGQEGKGSYLLLVDEKGKVAGCQVLAPTGVPILDAMACVVIEKRAKFVPARDKNGKPVRSTVVTPPITWQLDS
jgi:TonB family protein